VERFHDGGNLHSRQKENNKMFQKKRVFMLNICFGTPKQIFRLPGQGTAKVVPQKNSRKTAAKNPPTVKDKNETN
jgi:hypothetical protein